MPSGIPRASTLVLCVARFSRQHSRVRQQDLQHGAIWLIAMECAPGPPHEKHTHNLNKPTRRTRTYHKPLTGPTQTHTMEPGGRAEHDATWRGATRDGVTRTQPALRTANNASKTTNAQHNTNVGQRCGARRAPARTITRGPTGTKQAIRTCNGSDLNQRKQTNLSQHATWNRQDATTNRQPPHHQPT